MATDWLGSRTHTHVHMYGEPSLSVIFAQATVGSLWIRLWLSRRVRQARSPAQTRWGSGTSPTQERRHALLSSHSAPRDRGIRSLKAGIVGMGAHPHTVHDHGQKQNAIQQGRHVHRLNCGTVCDYIVRCNKRPGGPTKRHQATREQTRPIREE